LEQVINEHDTLYSTQYTSLQVLEHCPAMRTLTGDWFWQEVHRAAEHPHFWHWVGSLSPILLAAQHLLHSGPLSARALSLAASMEQCRGSFVSVLFMTRPDSHALIQMQTGHFARRSLAHSTAALIFVLAACPPGEGAHPIWQLLLPGLTKVMTPSTTTCCHVLF
jgi:hypothetical protein